MNNKPEIVFTFPNCMGGVTSFNYNIINNSKLISNFYSKVILLQANEDNRPPFLDKFVADEVIVFKYSYKENQYFVQKRLNDLLGNRDGAIITDNHLTLDAASRFKNKKTIFHLLHDFFYVKQNIQFESRIDIAVAHSSFFSDAVYASNPSDFGNRIFYIPYGVKQLEQIPLKQENERLNIVFLGRLDEGKGVMLLNEIELILQQNNVTVNWSIIGKGPLKEKLHKQWKSGNNVSFYEPNSTDEVFELLKNQDIFVFPTSFEGTPVSILECLANGVVTITNDLPGGIRDIVTENFGFRCSLDNTQEFAKFILTLNSNRGLLKAMQKNCYQLAKEKYDIQLNADNYFKLFMQFLELKRTKKPVKPLPLSKLDRSYFPNFLVKTLRSLR